MSTTTQKLTVQALAQAMADAPDDQHVRDVLSDLLLDLGVPRAEEKAKLLREGKLTGRHPWAEVSEHNNYLWSNWTSDSLYWLDKLGRFDRSEIPTEILSSMQGVREGTQGNMTCILHSEKAAWEAFVQAVAKWAVGE